ncbi:MAG: hypothetical protein J5791_06115 [Fibrobacter sp.]|nr:hypothetical protein [Fibrobacter sp.]
MDIKKSKISGNREWSQSTQKRLASMLGITAALSISGAALTACETVAGGDIENTESSSSEVILDGMGPIDDRWQDVSSSSVSSSSSGKMSSSLEPTSGISSNSEPPRPMSSSEILQPGIPLQESSSSYEIDTLTVTSGEVYIEPESGSNIDTGHLESSSSVAEPQSSSSEEVEPLGGDPIEIEPVEVGPMLSGVIEDTPVRMDEPEQ